MVRSMASELLQRPIPACHVAPATPTIQITKSCRVISATHLKLTKHPPGFRLRSTIKATTQRSGLVDGNKNIEVSSYYKSVGETKKALFEAIQGINRGIFGVPSAKKAEIECLVQLLESQNPTPDPTEDLKKVDGWWKLLYSTITILGTKRTKLGLRDFVALGDFLQIIDVGKGKAVNVIEFNVRGLKMLTGQLTVWASFNIASKSIIEIKYENSTVAPDQVRPPQLHTAPQMATNKSPRKWSNLWRRPDIYGC
eukprot:TRINITY_DN3897_c0_g1_i2.p1 TRINITY_DN3897_c0_g1~~TRINITY_DN3897_c0_g1_i2.p1  ORF type:complete len:254 (-),score=23.95 TRINITY_DN3897_c0_g1_i2:242-1003(-)